MRLTPDAWIFWQHGFFKLNATIVFTWVLMLVLTLGAALITRRLATGHERSRWQNLLEIVVTAIVDQIEDRSASTEPRRYLGFLGTLFLFVAVCGPGHRGAGLRAAHRVAVDHRGAGPVRAGGGAGLFGISSQGLGGYLKSYLRPTPIMLPFNLISEVSRTLALAVRLFGNMMSGAMIIAILLSITPFVFPIVMTVLGLLTGMVQAYIFTILAAVYIAAATRCSEPGQAARRRAERHAPLNSKGTPMDSLTWIAVASIVMAGLTTGFGTMGPALAEGRAVAVALTSLAQQPDASATITRTLFVGLAMIESTAIYCFVVSMILIFANPFWNAAVAAAAQAAGK